MIRRRLLQVAEESAPVVQSAPAPSEVLLQGLNPEQVEAVQHHLGPMLVGAGAGSGKTEVITRRAAYLEVVHKVPGSRILICTFSKKAADEMNERLRRRLPDTNARVGTFHSVALQFLKEEHPEYRIGAPQGGWAVDDGAKYRYCVKDTLGFRGMDWQAADLTLVLQFIGLCKARCALPGTPEAAEFARKFWEKGFKAPQRNPELMCQAYEGAEQLRRERLLVTFDDMLLEMWRESSTSEDVRARWQSRWDFVMQDEAQDENPVQGDIAEKLAMGHRNYAVVGDPAQCHPPGVKVEVQKGMEVPIEQLVDGNYVRGWNRNAQKMVAGRRVQVGTRPYQGKLYTMEVQRVGQPVRAVPMTDNHRLLCRWTDRKSDVCVTYLMHREGYGYRVGWCKLFSHSPDGYHPLHLAARARIEKADAVWVLKVHATRTGASQYESIMAAKYGLPTVTFEPVNGAQHLTESTIRGIFSALASENAERGVRCLAEHDRSPNYPLYPFPGEGEDKGRRTYFTVYACNLLPGLMSVPLPDAPNCWEQIDAVGVSDYEGPVYSLDVEEDHSYSANGVVVLNCIFSFRGSESTRLLNFQKKWPGAKVVLMNRNYRCGDSIISAANGLLRAMAPETRLDMELRPERGVPGHIEGKVYLDADAEAGGVVQQLQQLHEDGAPWRSMVVLYRTNAQSRALEEACLGDRVPYVVVGGVNFYERREVKDLLAYLRLAAGRCSFEDVRRSINAPMRYLGKAFVQQVEAAASRGSEVRSFGRRMGPSEREGKPDWVAVVRATLQRSGVQQRQVREAERWCTVVEDLSRRVLRAREPEVQQGSPEHRAAMPATMLEHVLQVTGYVAWLTRDEGTESPENNRVSNVRELVRAAERFTTVDELLDYVEDTLERAEQAKSAGEQPDRVTLMSIHRSKGLEWPVVFFVGANDRIIPHHRCEDEGEERRLAYVCVTRARDSLYVSCMARSAVGDRVVPLRPSKFLSEAGIAVVEVGAPQSTRVDSQVGVSP